MIKLDPRLVNDTHHICNTDISTILLHKNAHVPWLIIVPHTKESEFLLLNAALQAQLLQQSSTCAEFLLKSFPGTKLNFAAIGNVVSQCHLHIVLRSDNDICWPKPVWGNLPDDKIYTDEDIDSLKNSLINLLIEHYS